MSFEINNITINTFNKRLKNYSSNDLKNLFEKNYSILINQLPESKTITRRQSLENLKKAYKNESLVLVLGAGVSIDFKVPSWSVLLQNLMVHTIEKEKKDSEVISKLFNDIFKPSPLIAGRYLQNYFSNNDKTSFETMVRKVLYSTAKKNNPSNQMDEIVKLCAAPGKSPNLDSIITYNFDDILEYNLDKTNMDIPYKSVFGLGIDIKNNELPIFHVHGFLPENKKLSKSNQITFGENNYHQQYSDIYSWNNIIQINKFRDNTCLFIGSSLTDPNIRRLLDIALKQKGNKRKHHYIFKKRFNIAKLERELIEALKSQEILDEKLKSNLNFDDVLKYLNEVYERFEENDSASFGVKTIWVDDWSEVPKILKQIRESIA